MIKKVPNQKVSKLKNMVNGLTKINQLESCEYFNNYFM